MGNEGEGYLQNAAAGYFVRTICFRGIGKYHLVVGRNYRSNRLLVHQSSLSVQTERSPEIG